MIKFYTIEIYRVKDGKSLGLLYKGTKNDPFSWEFRNCRFQAKRWKNKETAETWCDQANEKTYLWNNVTKFRVVELIVHYEEHWHDGELFHVPIHIIH